MTGLDVSAYASSTPWRTSALLVRGTAERLPFRSGDFDLVLSINAIHNLGRAACVQALREIERVGREHRYVQVDSWLTEEQREKFERWQLTAATYSDPEGWRRLFRRPATPATTTGRDGVGRPTRAHPMKISVDSANLVEIEEALERGFPAGITTNPSILAKEQKGDFGEHMKKIIDLAQRYDYDIPLWVEVFSTKREEMIRQAEDFVATSGTTEHQREGPGGLGRAGGDPRAAATRIRVNCTCCMSYNQAVMAAGAGANYVSLFYGRINDIGYDAASVVRRCGRRSGRAAPRARSSWAASGISPTSTRRSRRERTSSRAAQVFRQMVSHPKTDEAVNQFITDFQKWLE